MEADIYTPTPDDVKRGQRVQRRLRRNIERKRKKGWKEHLFASLIFLAITLPAILFLSSYQGADFWLALYVVLAPIAALIAAVIYYQRGEVGRYIGKVGSIHNTFADNALVQKRGFYTVEVAKEAIVEHKLDENDLILLLSDGEIITIPKRTLRDLESVEKWLVAK